MECIDDNDNPKIMLLRCVCGAVYYTMDAFDAHVNICSGELDEKEKK